MGDGIHFNVRGDNHRSCILVLIGATDKDKKELIAIEDGFRESEQSWSVVLQGLRNRHLDKAPKLAIGDGVLGFWEALANVYPEAKGQRCWVHKITNVLNKLPKSVQPKVKDAINRFEAMYARAMSCLVKCKTAILAFYDFPVEHWCHIRTSYPL